MMELITRTARLVPYAKRPKQVPSFVSVKAYEPAREDPSVVLGSLFVLVEVLVSGRPGEDVAELIMAAFQASYFGFSDDETTTLERFEIATKATNTALGELVNQGNAAWIGKLSAIIAVQAGHELHLTHTGSAEAFLYRNNATTPVTGGNTQRSSGPTKTFGLVASGQLESGDHLLLATPALLHQISLPKLHDVASSNSPASTIAELTEILKGVDASRIGALAVEVTTPELAALQVRTTHPSEQMLGAPETPLEAARIMAAPITQATAAAGTRASKAAQAGWKQARPKLAGASRAAVVAGRTALSGQKLASRGLIGLVAIGIIAAGFTWHASRSAENAKLVASYKTDYAAYVLALSSNTDDTKRAALTSVAETIENLAHKQGQLNAILSNATLPTGAPKSIAAFQNLISANLDKLDGLIKVDATTVVNLDSFKNFTPSFIEQTSGSIYLISKNNPQLIVVDKTTKLSKNAAVDLANIGTIVSTTLASTGDGIYLLTNTPSVWFYRFGSTSVNQISLGLSGWESGSSIASYGGNLYVLSVGKIEKHQRTSTGFSPATPYASGGQSVSEASMLAVDGYVYVSGSDGLHQYLSGSAKSILPARNGLTNLSSLRPTSNSLLIGVSSASGRIGVWSDSDSLVYVRQYELNNVNKLVDASYDSSTKTFYVVTGTKLVSFDGAN